MGHSIARVVVKELNDDCLDGKFILSKREKDIFGHLEEGLSYKKIAEKLNIGQDAVHAHIKKI